MFKHKDGSVTPRPYLSWSQFNLFRSSKMRYVSAYIYGEKYENEGMYEGKKFADMLEKDEAVDDPVIEQIRIMLPSFKEREFEISTEVGGIPLFGKFDGFDKKKLVLDEIKTGQNGWDQRRVDKCEQITFYSLLIHQAMKEVPKKIRLHYIPTEKVNGKIRFTGDYKTFITKRDIGDIVNLLVPIKKTWEEIKKVSKEEYKSIGKL